MKLTDKLRQLDALHEAVSAQTLECERIAAIEKSKDVLGSAALAKLLVPLEATVQHAKDISANISKLSATLQNPVSEQNTVVLQPQNQEL
ncbi:UNVERIFIED_CONTAM: hypothetical protein HDU68_006260, partial [Siphonaria sp. JEL0065]